MVLKKTSNSVQWLLAGKSNQVAWLGDVSVSSSPFSIGRRKDADLPINDPLISGSHAYFLEKGRKLFIQDEGSRNGTFVNGERIDSETEVRPGDLIQFANSVFCLVLDEELDDQRFSETMVTAKVQDAQNIIDLENLISLQEFEVHLQSIVDLMNYQTIGFEGLVRTKLFKSPLELFSTAEEIRQEIELSEVIRRKAAIDYLAIKDLINSDGKKLFLNTHPNEVHDIYRLIRSMEELRNEFGELDFVLEIHESAVTDMKNMAELCNELSQLDIEIAYDDFGAGQARFIELIEDPPAYLKFDIRLVRNIHQASARRKKAIEQLVKMVSSL
ncbi:MAG: EAL domain-containing protein, partial [Planctomycetota bacterium]